MQADIKDPGDWVGAVLGGTPTGMIDPGVGSVIGDNAGRYQGPWG